MEKIERRDGHIYYGEKQCGNADDAYCSFRQDYHDGLGKRVYRRLARLGSRKERVHGFGVDFTREYSDELADRYEGYGRVRCRIMGIVGISYCRMVGLWDMAVLPDDEYDTYLDWLIDRRSNALYVVGRNVKTGRTATRKKKYR